MIYYVAGFVWGCANWAPLLRDTDYHQACIAWSVIVAAVLLFCARPESGVRLRNVNWVGASLILAVGVGLLASVVASSEPESMQMMYEGFLLFSFFAVVKLIRGGRENIERFVQGMLLVAGGTLLVSFLCGDANLAEGDYTRLGTETGWNPNSLAYVASSVAVIALSHVLDRSYNVWIEAYYSSLSLLGIVVTIATKSRTSIGVLLFGLAYLLLRSRSRAKKYLIACAGILAMWLLFDEFLAFARWEATLGEVSEVTPLAGREELWRDGLRLFQESPVIGNGFISDRRTVHNAYLEIAVKTGVLGLMCYLPLLAVAVRKSFRSRLSGDWMRAILYMGLIQAMAESHLVSYGVFSGAMFTLSLFQFITEDTPSSARRAARHSPGWGMRWCEPSLGRNF